MAKPEWGVKRTCLACATRFYDMRKKPILCPSCGVKFDVETIFRPRRSRAPVDEPVAAAAAAKPETPAAAEDDGDDIEKELAALADDSVDDDDDDDDAAIEDTSDLADDDSDVPIVPKDINDESN